MKKEHLLSSYLKQKLGELALSWTEREDLIDLFSLRPVDWEALLKSDGFNLDLIKVMLRLPGAYRTPAITKVMGTVDLFEHFLDLIDKLEASDFPDKAELMEELQESTENWENLTSVLKQIYLRLPLTRQVIPDDGVLKYLPSGLAVLDADLRYNTALHRKLPFMARADMQVYEWCEAPSALVVVSRYRTRWILSSVWGSDGEENDELTSRIACHIRQYGVEGPPELVDRLELFQRLGEFDLNMLLIRLI